MSVYKGDKPIVSPARTPELTTDAVPIEGSQHLITSGGVYNALLTKEGTTNKVTTLNASATDDQYPSAKAVYNALKVREPVNIEYARDLYAPDWSQAVVIPQKELQSGYTAPKRGIFVGSTIPQTVPGISLITVNGIQMGFGYIVYEDIRAAYINIPVSPGDVIKSGYIMVQDGNHAIYFVPYKRQ